MRYGERGLPTTATHADDDFSSLEVTGKKMMMKKMIMVKKAKQTKDMLTNARITLMTTLHDDEVYVPKNGRTKSLIGGRT